MKENADALWRLARTGNEAAACRLVTVLEAPIYRLMLSKLRCREDAEDATQETFLKLFRSMDSFRGDSSVLTYALRIAEHVATDELRRRSHAPESLTVTDETGNETDRDVPDPDPDAAPDAFFARAATVSDVRRALEQLTPDARTVLTLRDVEGLSYEDIAAVLSLNPGTVKSRISRARDALAKILRNFGTV